MGRGDEVVDLSLIFLEEGVNVLLVDDAGALGLREDKVEEEQEADVAVEGDPDEDEGDPGFSEKGDAEDDPVHQPGRELGGVGGLEGFVGCEDGKEEGSDGAIMLSLVNALLVEAIRSIGVVIIWWWWLIVETDACRCAVTCSLGAREWRGSTSLGGETGMDNLEKRRTHERSMAKRSNIFGDNARQRASCRILGKIGGAGGDEWEKKKG